MEGVTRGGRKWRNVTVHDLHHSPRFIGVIELRRMRRAGHVDCKGKKINSYRIFGAENQK